MTAHVRPVRPYDADTLAFPTTMDLARAERAALLNDQPRRALAYRIMRMRRLRRAQREAVS